MCFTLCSKRIYWEMVEKLSRILCIKDCHVFSYMMWHICAMAPLEIAYPEHWNTFWMQGDENSDVEQGEYLLLYPKLHLQHVGTCRAWKNKVFGPFSQWFSEADHSLCEMERAPILSKTTWHLTCDGQIDWNSTVCIFIIRNVFSI